MSPAARAKALLERNRRQATKMATKTGVARTKQVLLGAHKELTERLAHVESFGAGPASYTAAQKRQALVQIQELLKSNLLPGVKSTLLETAAEAAEFSVEGTIDYLVAADKAFRGSAAPLALDEAAMFEAGVSGVETSILSRLAFGPEEGAAKLGIIQRYGVETIKSFEGQLQQGLLTGASWAEMRDGLIESSDFLQGKPAWWAMRIVRTEVMGAVNKSGVASIQEADEQLGDMVKILCATFDDRTGADSYAVHGQIRRPEEPFESWYGAYSHPPNRPNDRECVVPHRISWPIPEHLAWRSEDEIDARWAKDGRKGSPPERPEMTTVPLEEFGQPQPRRGEEGESSPGPESD